MASSASLTPFNFSYQYKQGGGDYIFARDHAVQPRIQRIAVQNTSAATLPITAGSAVNVAFNTYEPTLSTLPSSLFVDADDTVNLPHAGHWDVRIECNGDAAGASGSTLTWGIRIGSAGAILPLVSPVAVQVNTITQPRMIVSGSVYIPAGKAWQVVCSNATGATTYTIDYALAGPPAVYFTVVFTYRGQ